MKATDLIRALQASGMDDSAILKAVAAIEEARLAKARARTAKWRKNKKNGDAGDIRDARDIRDVTNVTLARVEGSSSSTETSGKKDNKGTANAALVIELETVLDPEHAAAVIEHRRIKRCPMTVRAAKMLAKQFAKTSDPNAAADTMLARGWTGFEPEWLSNGKAANGGGEVLYKFSTLEEVLTPEELERAMNG